jgi:hypothetical protein
MTGRANRVAISLLQYRAKKLVLEPDWWGGPRPHYALLVSQAELVDGPRLAFAIRT